MSALSETKIKICGITDESETVVLNEQNVEYAGFVFFEGSKRNLSVEKAKEIMKLLSPKIQRVAVTVSPDVALVKEIMAAGFDILQVHGRLDAQVCAMCKLPIWRAVNIINISQLEETLSAERELAGITGYVIDGAEYGSGKPFCWDKMPKELYQQLKEKQFILAGGLNDKNVAEGIELFAPEVVDVSTGVETTDADGRRKKDAEKIRVFVRKVREHE